MATPGKQLGRCGAARHGRRLLKSARRAAKQLIHRDDEEALHRFRVRVRKLRTFLQTYRKRLGPKRVDKAIARLGRLIDATNTSRDLQVQLLWLDKVWNDDRLDSQARQSAHWMTKHLSSHGPGAQGVDVHWLARSLKKSARQLNKQLKTLVEEGQAQDRGKQHMAFNWIAGRQIIKSADRLAERLATIRGLEDRKPAHRARLTAKRLRYLVEQMRRQTDQAGPAVAELKGLQDMLGELRDRQMLEAEINQCLEHGVHDEDVDREVLDHGLRELIEALRQEQQALHQQLEQTWLQDHGRIHLEPARLVGKALQGAP